MSPGSTYAPPRSTMTSPRRGGSSIARMRDANRTEESPAPFTSATGRLKSIGLPRPPGQPFELLASDSRLDRVKDCEHAATHAADRQPRLADSKDSQSCGAQCGQVPLDRVRFEPDSPLHSLNVLECPLPAERGPGRMKIGVHEMTIGRKDARHLVNPSVQIANIACHQGRVHQTECSITERQASRIRAQAGTGRTLLKHGHGPIHADHRTGAAGENRNVASRTGTDVQCATRTTRRDNPLDDGLLREHQRVVSSRGVRRRPQLVRGSRIEQLRHQNPVVSGRWYFINLWSARSSYGAL